MLKVGCAKVDITPDFPVYMCGYGFRNSRSNGIEDPLSAGILLLTQGKAKVLMLTIDSLGIGVNECQRLYNDLEKATNGKYNAASIYLACSHTHFAPGLAGFYVTFTGGDEIGFHPAEKEYYPLLLKQLLKGIRQAEENLEEVTIEEASIPVSSVSFNRRTIVKKTGLVETNYLYPEHPDKFNFQPYDTELAVWRFQDKEKCKAILARFSCHPVTGGKNPMAISADWPGYFQKMIQEEFGCPGLFLQGSAGDIVPINREGTCRQQIAKVLVDSIKLAARKWQKVKDFSLEMKVFDFSTRLHLTYPRKNVNNLWCAELAKFTSCEMPPKNNLKLRHLAYMHEYINTYPSNAVVLPVRLLRLGTRVLVGMPFEVLTEINTKLRTACPEAIITGITGGYEGYLPLPKEFRLGGYEATWGPRFAKSAGKRLLKQAIKAVQEFQK